MTTPTCARPRLDAIRSRPKPSLVVGARGARCSLMALFFLSLCGTATAQIPLNDTGIDWWADDRWGFLTSEPEGYAGQDASHGRDRFQHDDSDGHAGFSFTKLDATGSELPADALTWSCVRDDVTGLIWEVKTDDGGLHDWDDRYSWYNPDPDNPYINDGPANPGAICAGYVADNPTTWCNTSAYIARVNAAGWCGANDWRLPGIEELRSILDYGRYRPSVDADYFPNTQTSTAYLSTSSSANGNPLRLVFYYGEELMSSVQSDSVRLVRGGPALPSVSVTVDVVEIPGSTPPLRPADAVTIAWTTTGAEPSDFADMVLSMTRVSEMDGLSTWWPPRLSPNDYDSLNRFIFAEATTNDGTEQVTIPGGLMAGDDWSFCVGHIRSGVVDCSETFTYQPVIRPVRITYSPGLEVRQGPATSEPTITWVSGNQAFVAFDSAGEADDLWYKIHIPCDNAGACSGWIPGTGYAVEEPSALQVEIGNDAPSSNIQARPGGAMLDRAGPGQRFVTFAQASAGSGCTSPWLRIHLPRSSNAESGWVCGDGVAIVGSAEGAVLGLTGRVTRGGVGLADVTLTLGGGVTATTRSGADGTYSFSNLPSGAYDITPAFASDLFNPPNRAVRLAGASRGGLDFRACDEAAPLTGAVIDATTSMTVAGVTVTVDGSPADITDDDGAYSIAGLTCGAYEIGVSHAGYVDYLQSVDLFDTDQLDILLTKESTTNGVEHYGGMESDPVNTATGNYIYQRRDLEIPGIGLPLRFDRVYNSRAASSPGAAGAPLGYGWAHSYQVRLAEDAGGIVTITWGDGHTETYTPDGSGGYRPQYGVFDSLADNGDGTFRLTKRDRTAFDIDTSGRLVAITDKNANRIALTYDGADLIEITDTVGRVVTLDYDSSGRITQITDPIGRTVRYVYDVNGDLTRATDPKGNLTRYSYDGQHQIRTVIDPRSNAIVNNTYDGRRVVTYQTDAKGGATSFDYQELDRITTITDALGNVTVHQHDALLRLIREEDPRGGVAQYAYDSAGNRVRVTDKNGNVTHYDYDARGNVTRKTDALGNITEISYDANNRPLSRTDALGQVTQFAYDAKGNLTQTTNALGNVSHITYDDDGRGLLTTITDPNDNTITHAYDDEGNLIQVTDALGHQTTYTYDGIGRRLTETDALGHQTSFSYDANDNLVQITDALGGVVTHTYDGNDNKLSTTDRLGRTTRWAYDKKDLLISETNQLGNAETYAYDSLDRRSSRTDRRGNTTWYTYDAVGNRIERTNALGNLTSYAFDLNGNQVSRTDARGNTTTTSYDALNRQTKVQDALGNTVVTAYDALGRVVTVTAPGGRVTEHRYDALGRPLQTTDPEGGITRFGDDANGNRISRTDANGHVTRIAYDALNRPISQIDALGHTSTTTYDAAGNVLTMTDANGETTSFSYDELDRLTQVTDAEDGRVQYSYDKNGNQLSMTDPNGHVTSYTYDVLDRRITMTEPLGYVTRMVYDAVGNLIQKTDPKGQLIGYSYDAVNRRAGIDYPNQFDVSFDYDAVGNLISMTDGLGTTTHVYDRLDRRASTTDPFGQQVGYGYDAVGNRVSLTYPGAKIVAYAFDKANRLTRVTDWLGNQTSYSYDAASRLTDTLNANGTMAAYRYDDADRLTGLTNAKSNGSIINTYSYILDPVGNHLSEDRTEPLSPLLTATIIKDTHDAENRLIESGGVTNGFDVNGNLTAKGADSFAYDAADRLIETNIAGISTQYEYDALGNRYNRTRNGIETRFVLDTNSTLTNLLMETDGTGSPLAYNVYGRGLISRILPDNGVMMQYHYDARGSTIAMTDAAENVVQTYAYDPFGRIANTDGAAVNPFGFLGRYGVLDEEEDLSYIQARYYDSEQQRFVTKDAKFGMQRLTQSFNRYSYSLNSPLRYIDFTGYSGQTIESSLNDLASSSDPNHDHLLDPDMVEDDLDLDER